MASSGATIQRKTPFLRRTERARGGEIKEEEIRYRDWKIYTGRGIKMTESIPLEAEISYKAGPES